MMAESEIVKAVLLLKKLPESAEKAIHHLTDIQLSAEQKRLKANTEETKELLKIWEEK